MKKIFLKVKVSDFLFCAAILALPLPLRYMKDIPDRAVYSDAQAQQPVPGCQPIKSLENFFAII